MINTSEKYKKALEKERRFISRVSCLLKNGTTLEFNKNNLMGSGVSISDVVSSSGSFDIGAAIVNQLTLMVCNVDDAFSDYDFTDAVLTVFIGLEFSDGNIEWLKKGVFTASDPTTTPDIISLKADDNMCKFDTTYDGDLSFPATLQSIVQYCCSNCGVLLFNGQFPNYAYRITKNPFDEKSNVTYRALIAYCALLAGCYARCNIDGRLELKWYATTAFDSIIGGGVFDKTTAASYQTGINLDGGNFTNYSAGSSADGGSFTETLPYHHIYSFSSLSVSTEDVVITGIRVKASDSENAEGKKVEGETYLCGAEGYILDVSGNPLIEAGKAKTVAEYLASRIVGMKFRPFTASAIGDPSWEAGDPAVITDRKGNSYYTYLTNVTYSTGGYASISCDAEPAARHSADRYAEINKIVADIKKDSQQKLSEYAKYVDQMNQLAINAMGYYETSETQSDGSTINYMHDKPLLSQSTIVYKKSIDGFFISRDGGKTYVGGMDKDANIVANVIAAIGISFDWAKGGTLTLGGDSNAYGILNVVDKNGNQSAHLDNERFVTTGYDNVIGKSFIEIKGALMRGVRSQITEEELWCVGYAATYVGNKQIQYVRFHPGKDADRIKFGGYTQYLETVGGAFTKLNSINGNTEVQGDFTVSGTKARNIKTENFNNRLLYAYEMPTPYFGDLGSGTTDENGECVISIDDIFSEAVSAEVQYSVFLQKEGSGELWVALKDANYFLIKGSPNLRFSWEIKAVQKDYEYYRLEDLNFEKSIGIPEENDLEDIFENELQEYDSEMEALEYEDFESISGD